MKVGSKVIILFVLMFALSACNHFAPRPTETAIPTGTSLPTSTSTPRPTITPNATEKPTKTPVPPTETPSAPVLQMPSGKPVTSWEGFPIMPGAIAGDGDSRGYAFTVKASPEEVQRYYEKALANLGWNLFASGQGSTDALLVMFMKGTGTVSISIIPQPGDLVYVLLVK